MIKFAVKVGLAASAVYYTKQQGIWRDSDESLKAYNKIKSELCPYVKQITSRVPIELPQVPKADSATLLLKQCWNKGVHASFVFLINLPEYTKEYTRKGLETLTSNEDLKKFIDSFSTESNEPTKK
ncbi:MICOS complex subunit MIC13 homolog QIL1 [Cylas formicarius]|uniref:MICOS complex subunit MIC13 homolog QIL1 n=1 Tax=Cylas formicarius TaxID=197179 RepID=UPI002958795D|nr:MICOS complex subunit MIC13 homolog QIL1 [Cylas formicarius]